jgi:hypothetical protein
MGLARLTALLSLVSLLLACGSNPAPPQKIDGAWKASLQNSPSTLAYSFTTILTQGTGSTVDVSGFQFFVGASPCFTSPLGETATFTGTGQGGGFETDPFAMNISTAFGTGVENVLTLEGTRNSDGTISGNWSITGLSGCSGSGTYTMQLLPTM